MEGNRKAPKRPGLSIPRRGRVSDTPEPVYKPVTPSKPAPVKRVEPPVTPVQAQPVFSSKKQLRQLKKARAKAEKQNRKEALKALRTDEWSSPKTTRAAQPRQDDKDISNVWEEMSRIRNQDDRLEQEYKVTRARQRRLKHELKSRHLEGNDLSLKGFMAPDTYEKYQKRRQQAGKAVRKLGPYYGYFTRITKKQLAATKRAILRRPDKRTALALGVTAVVLGGGFYGLRTLQNRKTTSVEGAKITEAVAKPKFDPVLPEGVDPESASFDAERGVIGAQDDVDGALITISQQEAPADLRQDPGKLQQIAASVGASVSIDTLNGKAYIATAKEENSRGQRVVFMTSDTLVFITSPRNFTPSQWITYVGSFKK